jgi:restriction endonuclease Mrr
MINGDPGRSPGSTLGHLMVRHGIGVQVRRTYQLVDVDEDFFDE